MIDPDLWVKIAASKIANASPGDRHVISDVRFANEVASIKSQGGVIIRIIRPGVEPVRSHVSESNVGDLDWDYTILNNGSIDDLRYAIDRGLEYLERSQEAA
jgi:hypothetical protein